MRVLQNIAISAILLGFYSMASAQSVPLLAPETLPESTETQTSVPVTDANVINRIIIQGAERIDERTILEYLAFEPGGAYTAGLADESVKILFSTGLFANIAVERDGNDVVVRVQENPVINRIAFEGNERIDDAILQAETGLTQRSVYSRSKVQSATQRVLDIYRRRGRYAAKVEPQIIERDQNRIDLVFEIEEGQLSQLKKIFFNGNNFFTDADLKGEIASREYQAWNFLASGDTYDPDRVQFDTQLLQNHYFRYGFIDYALASAVGELLEDRSGFYVTFAFREGERYRIGEVNMTSAIPEVDPEEVLQAVDIPVDTWYDQDVMDEKRGEITDYLGDLGYAFTNVGLSLQRREKEDEDSPAIVDLQFDIQPSSQVYIERIDIRGNVRTVDSVIRREFQLAEGDPYNRNKLSLTQRGLQRLGYFSNVSISERQGSAPDQAVIEVDVEEQSTGSLNFGVGYSTTDGGLFSISLQENNLLGKGHEFQLRYAQTKQRNEYSLGYAKPYFLDYDVKAGVQVYRDEEEQENSQGYENEETGLRFTASYPLGNYLSQSVFYRIADRERVGLVTRNGASGAPSDASDCPSGLRNPRVVGADTRFCVGNTQEDGILSEIGQTIAYDTRNSVSTPTQGYRLALTSSVAGIGGDYEYIRNVASGVYYTPIARSDWTWLIGGDVGNIWNFGGDNVSRGDRFFLGGRNLRGFDTYGAGSRSTRSGGYALGGTAMATATTELRRPILPESFGVTGSIFSDVGWIAGIEKDIAEARDESIRASVGVGASVITPLGPMRFDFASPIKKEKYDRTKTFQFTFRSRF